MIKTWKHKGLRNFYQPGNKAGIQASHVKRLKMILQLLDAITKPEEMDLPGMKFHALKGNYAGFYTVTINGNWRVIFKIENNDVILVDYVDYH